VRGGDDVIDADQLDLDFTPTGYSRDGNPADTSLLAGSTLFMMAQGV